MVTYFNRKSFIRIFLLEVLDQNFTEKFTFSWDKNIKFDKMGFLMIIQWLLQFFVYKQIYLIRFTC